MALELNIGTNPSEDDPLANQLIQFLKLNSADLELANALLYFDFPIYKDGEGRTIISKVLLLSAKHGLVVFDTSNATGNVSINSLAAADESIDTVTNHILSRLVKVRSLKKTKSEFLFPISAFIYAPNIAELPSDWESDNKILITDADIRRYLQALSSDGMPANIFQDLTSTIEGAKAISGKKERIIAPSGTTTKGTIVDRLEAEIANFDKQQKHGYISEIVGPQRIRGLAGSGKTVILAMKAAQLHLRHPDATILYTFYTKSLYQHIKRLIARCYRQFDDAEPDWTKLRILHAWGGYPAPGA